MLPLREMIERERACALPKAGVGIYDVGNPNGHNLSLNLRSNDPLLVVSLGKHKATDLTGNFTTTGMHNF